LTDYKYTVVDLGANPAVQEALASSGAESISQIRENLQKKED